ncbi:MAG: AAA family ATPase, partial [Acetobacteraceae bacterium]|nr:AAA family ATPase [Acetobacteraceae bacterium]
VQPLLAMIESGEFQASRNTVLVIDEISQVAPRALLALLELQRRTGLTIKALGDREQTQAVEASDAVEIMRRVLPKADRPEILSTVRQVGRNEAETRRLRTIAGLFRGGEPDPEASPAQRQGDHLDEVRQALDMKREDGTAMLVGGDQDQVVGRIADLAMARRDVLRASGSQRGITVSAPTNADAADISQAIRARMRARGELGDDEVVYKAIARRGDAVDEYDLPLATGDRVRLFRRTWARIAGEGGAIGNNGDIVEVVGRTANGLRLRDKDGRVGEVEWRRLLDAETGRLLLGFGHAFTIDAAQGITSDEHINALPRGTAGVTGFTAYSAESRARGTTWTVIAEAAQFEAVRHGRALGDTTPVTVEDLWTRAAQDMAAKPYKPLGMDLANSARADRARAIAALIRQSHAFETLETDGRRLGREARQRVQAEAVRHSLPKHIAALDAAIVANATMQVPKLERELHLRGLRVEAEVARRTIEDAAKPRRPSPGPGM